MRSFESGSVYEEEKDIDILEDKKLARKMAYIKTYLEEMSSGLNDAERSFFTYNLSNNGVQPYREGGKITAIAIFPDLTSEPSYGKANNGRFRDRYLYAFEDTEIFGDTVSSGELVRFNNRELERVALQGKMKSNVFSHLTAITNTFREEQMEAIALRAEVSDVGESARDLAHESVLAALPDRESMMGSGTKVYKITEGRVYYNSRKELPHQKDADPSLEYDRLWGCVQDRNYYLEVRNDENSLPDFVPMQYTVVWAEQYKPSNYFHDAGSIANYSSQIFYNQQVCGSQLFDMRGYPLPVVQGETDVFEWNCAEGVFHIQLSQGIIHMKKEKSAEQCLDEYPLHKENLHLKNEISEYDILGMQEGEERWVGDRVYRKQGGVIYYNSVGYERLGRGRLDSNERVLFAPDHEKFFNVPSTTVKLPSINGIRKVFYSEDELGVDIYSINGTKFTNHGIFYLNGDAPNKNLDYVQGATDKDPQYFSLGGKYYTAYAIDESTVFFFEISRNGNEVEINQLKKDEYMSVWDIASNSSRI